MRLLIVTGISGAGKSRAVNALEDMGWLCVDNLPPRLAPAFAQLLRNAAEPVSGAPAKSSNFVGRRAAIVMDARAGAAFSEVYGALDALRAEGQAYELLFLEADDETLSRRFKETRRQHPLCAQQPGLGVSEAIAAERRLLEPLRACASITLDTSQLSPAQCRARIVERFAENPQRTLRVRLCSFGFKAGTPRDCDLLFDVRCLPNPFYVPELKERTGLEPDVYDYVLSFEESRELLNKIQDMLLFLLPLYQKEGKNTLSAAFGCTGGRHRSVVFAEVVAEAVRGAGYEAHVEHRDI